MSLMSHNEMTPDQKAAEVARLKAIVDDRRREWDRLDAHGSQSDKQNAISAGIEHCVQKIKELTGEDY